MTNTVAIHADNLEAFNAKIAKLAKRANKLGLPAPIVTVGPVYLFTFRDERGVSSVAKCDVTIDPGSAIVKLEGWTFAALLCHEIKGANIVRTVRGGEGAIEWRTIPGKCEHCNKSRQRKDTAILTHEDGRTIQVGKSCLADFLGSSVWSALARAEYAHEVATLDDAGMGSGSGMADPLDFLARVARAIREDGWRSGAMAREHGGFCTADEVIGNSANYNPEPADLDTARASLEWARELEGASDYEHNIRTIARAGALRFRDLRMAASIVAGFQREQARLVVARRTAPAGESKHVGNVGEKIEISVCVERVITCESAYGVSLLHVMRDAAGNVFAWFASGNLSFEAGSEATIKGTIKAHNERNGVAQTVLTRCKAV